MVSQAAGKVFIPVKLKNLEREISFCHNEIILLIRTYLMALYQPRKFRHKQRVLSALPQK
jgi:hypothetical protein